jgi:hypothetical protein
VASHTLEDGADDTADNSAFGCLHGALLREILLDLVGEAGDGERLQPDTSGTGECCKEDAVAAEDHVFDARDALDLKGNARLKGTDVSRMDAKEFAGRQVLDDELTGELKPGDSLPGYFLQEEAVTTEDARAEGLLEADAEFDAGGGAEKAVTVDQVLVTWADLDRHDMAGDAGGKGDLAGGTDRAVLGHKERSAASDALDRSKETAAAGVLGMGGHLDGGGHPGKFAGLGDHGVVWAESEFKDWHRGAEDAVLHLFLLHAAGYPLPYRKVRKVSKRNTLRLDFDAL